MMGRIPVNSKKVFLFVVCLAVVIILIGTAPAATIIGGAVGNGNFEDFSGGWVEAGGTAGINGTYPNYTRIWRSAGQDLTSGVDGWTNRYRGGYNSFDTRTDAIPVGGSTPVTNKSFNLNQWATGHLTSDTYAVAGGLAEGDEIQLTFDTAGNLMRMSVCVILDKGLGTEATRWLVGDAINYVDFVTTDHTDYQNAGEFSYTLGVGESASTVTLFFTGYREDQGGADYGMIKRNNGTGCLDNVELTVVEGVPSTDYYVATVANGGDDSNPGTLAEPFATIQHAATQIQPGYTVYIREGVYRETVTPPQSGAAGYPITFEAYNGEEVIISGCDLITGWTNSSGDIWQATVNWDAGANSKGNTLFVNGDMKYEARQFAENDFMDITDWGYIAHGAMNSTYFTSSDLANKPAWPDDYFNGGTVRHHVNDWTVRDSEILDFESSTGKITFASVGVVSQKHYFGFYITHPDMAKTLDKPGEWFKTPGVNTLYYHAEPSQDPGTLNIEFRRRPYGFNVESRDYITIRGITFRGCSIDTNSSTDYNVYQSCTFYGYDKDYDGRFGISGNYNVFRDNELSQTYAYGLSVNGTFNDVINNYFHDIGGEGAAALYLSGSDHFVSHNTSRRMGRYFTRDFPPRTEYSYNFMEDGGQLTWDTAFFDADGGGGNGASCIIHHNVMRSPDTLGNYHAFYGGANLTFHHNIMYDWDPDYNLVHGSRKNFIKYIHNTFIGVAPTLSHHQEIFANVEQANYNNNLQLTIDNIATIGMNCRGNFDYNPSDFMDFANDDLRLAPGSGAIDAGIVLPGYNDGYTGAAPDAGALEYGEAMWDVGHDFANPPNPVRSWTALPGMNLFTNGQFYNAPTGWTYYAGTPTWFNGNAWNTKASGLSRLGQYSMQLNPGDGMSRVFTDLKPDTWYTVGSETRLTDQLIECEQYDSSQGTITIDDHRGEDYITGLADGDWVCYNNVNFSAAGMYDQLSATFTRPAGSPYDGNHNYIEIRLGSSTGTLLGEIIFTLGVIDTWQSSEMEFAPVSGNQTVCFVFKGPSVEQIRLANVRFQNTDIPAGDKLTIGIRNHGGTQVTSQIGYADWISEFEKFTFKTGASSTSAELFVENNGIYDAYFDQLGVWEQDPVTYDERDLVKSDGIVTTGTDFWQVEFVQYINVGKIEVFNVSDGSYLELSNFKVSAWDDDPSGTGQKLWEKDYFPTGSVAQGGSFVITGNEITSGGTTRLASILPKFIRIENNGTNAAGNMNLSLDDVSIFNLEDAPASDNVAPTGEAEQSSNYYIDSGHADTPINNRIFPPYDFTSTQPFYQSWWHVDLMQTPVIDQIVIFTRTGADYRIGSFRVSVWDGDPEGSGSEIWYNNYSYPGDINEDKSLVINGDVTSGGTRLDDLADGRFVRVQLYGTNFLHLTEVQVWNKQRSPDMSPNGFINLEDFSLFAECWLDSLCTEADFVGYGAGVDLEDFGYMVDHWLDTF